MSPKSLNDWLIHIESIHPKLMDLELSRIKKVAQSLGINKFSCPVITIAGTNGKGSCARFLENCWLTAGYRVGAYTSPHLFHYTERIHINGLPINEEALIQAFKTIEEARQSTSLTYFEFGTLAALWLFKQEPLDVVILEVGLGGRLDAVNIVDPDIAIITSIGLDHMDWLGHTRELIAKEKAGIFRKQKPAIIGDVMPPKTIRKIANKLDSTLFSINQDFSIKEYPEYWEYTDDNKTLTQLPYPHILLSNAATAIKAITLLQQKLPTALSAIKTALEKTQLPGRLERKRTNGIEHIIDVAHNPEAIKTLGNYLQKHPIKGKTIAVFGILTDKLIIECVKTLFPYVDIWYFGGLPEIPRGAPIEMIKDITKPLNLPTAYYEKNVIIAHEKACKSASAVDRILITGSFYTVAHCTSP